jgi:hypothetical protein
MSPSVCSLLYLTPLLNAPNPIPYSFRFFLFSKRIGWFLELSKKVDTKNVLIE